MLCRKGDITKQDIGVIRIFDKETQFEVSEAAAARFAATCAVLAANRCGSSG